eukprot:scaffold19147_cov83-Isochrysis_galbana.AAC.3
MSRPRGGGVGPPRGGSRAACLKDISRVRPGEPDGGPGVAPGMGGVCEASEAGKWSDRAA